MTHKILDSDTKLIEYELENDFELLIHYPEQILQAWDIAGSIKIATNINKITLNQNISDPLFCYWLKSLLNDNIEITCTNELHPPIEGELVVSTYFENAKDYNVTQKVKLDYLEKKFITREIDLSNVPSIDGKSVFLGAIARIIDNSGIYKTSDNIKHLIAIMVQKAGALTWRIPADKNFAKIWALKLCETGLNEVRTFDDHAFEETARFWQLEIFNSGIKNGNVSLVITSWDQMPKHEPNTELIFSDGKNKLERLVTLFQLVLIISVYCKLLTHE